MERRQKTIEMTGRGKGAKTRKRRITRKPAKEVSVRGKGVKGRITKQANQHLARRGVVKQALGLIYEEKQSVKIKGYSLTTQRKSVLLCASTIEVRSFR